MQKRYMAIDQYGNTEHGLRFPRKELGERYPGRVGKMFIDAPNSKGCVHVGYVVGQHWFNVYLVTPIGEVEK